MTSAHATFAVLAVVAACELPQSPGPPMLCGADVSCPAGQICMAQVCVPEPSTCAEAVTAGEAHTCAIRDDHTAWCWGRNHDGQLGDGTNEDRTEPTAVMTTTRFARIAAGTEHTCAIADDRSVWCWGSNASGQLGETVSSLAPVKVANVGASTAIALGSGHSCAIAEDGAVRCWGANDAGQLGAGTRNESSPPVTVVMLSNVQEIALRGNTSCAIDAAGALACWGSSGGGQLGGLEPRPSPTLVKPDVTFAHVAVGLDFWCAVSVGGEVICAGNNTFGQLGVSGRIGTPVVVPLPVRAATITAGDRFACATEARDPVERPRVWCWGQNSNAQLADGTGQDHSTPTLSDHSDVAASAGGGIHLCVVSSSGALTCSGYNGNGQLGDGQRTTLGAPPPAITGLAGAVSIAAGASHTCAVVGDGVLCWGRNNAGQLGDGTAIDRSRPVRVIGVSGAVAITVGRSHSCALLGDRTAMCWGLNLHGQLGDDTHELDRALPAPVLAADGSVLTEINQIVAGAEHTCALIGAGGAVRCWGNNSRNQIGVVFSTCFVCHEPVDVALPAGVRQLALGVTHSCALNGDGTAMCWGGSEQGQRGDGTIETKVAPTLVGVPDLLTGVDHIATFGEFSCSLAGGAVTCWGNGHNGEMGDRTYESRRTPGAPVALSGATSLAVGSAHACAITASGLACWGASYTGQGGPLGRGGYGNSTVPVPVSLAGATAIAVTAGAGHTCALLADHTVTCWGDGRVGQLGNGALDLRTRVAPRLPCP